MENNKLISKKDFKELPIDFRIESVIHDGQWITIDKLAKLALVPKEETEKWIDKNSDILIQSRGSYRVGYNKIIDWYTENNLSFSESLVPGNFPVKLFNGKTEVELLLSQRRRLVSHLDISGDSDIIEHKILPNIKYYGVPLLSDRGSVRIVCLDPDTVRKRILRSLNQEETKKISMSSKNMFFRRQFKILDERTKSEFIKEYMLFAKNALKGHQSTLKKFLHSKEEIESQIIVWIIEVYEKFDETKNVPFAAYLHNVLQWWPYNLSAEAMGPNLNKFTRSYKRATEKLNKSQEDYSDLEKIRENMDEDFDRDTFLEYYEQMLNWEFINSPNDSDDKIVMQKPNESPDDRHKSRILAHKLLISTLAAGAETRNPKDTFKIITTLQNELEDDSSLLANLGKEISQSFKEALWRNL